MKIEHFSVFSYSYFMRNCLWLFWSHVILIALHFEIKWEGHLRWLLLILLIRHCFYLQPFSHCCWYFLIDEVPNQLNCVIMLSLLLSSLKCILDYSTSLMNSEIYKCIYIIVLYIFMCTFVSYRAYEFLCKQYSIKFLTKNLIYLYQFHCFVVSTLRE